jgi:hypothetical protein
MVDMDDLPDETGGSQPAQKPAQSKPAATQERVGDLPDDLPDEGGSIAGASEREMAQDGGQDVSDYPDKLLVKGDPSPEQLAGADYYVTLEGVEKELSGIADSLEIGAWEGQDEELRTQIKCLQAIRLTLNNAINWS